MLPLGRLTEPCRRPNPGAPACPARAGQAGRGGHVPVVARRRREESRPGRPPGGTSEVLGRRGVGTVVARAEPYAALPGLGHPQPCPWARGSPHGEHILPVRGSGMTICRPGTNTPAATCRTSDGSTPHTTPVHTPGRGRQPRPDGRDIAAAPADGSVTTPDRTRRCRTTSGQFLARFLMYRCGLRAPGALTPNPGHGLRGLCQRSWCELEGVLEGDR